MTIQNIDYWLLAFSSIDALSMRWDSLTAEQDRHVVIALWEERSKFVQKKIEPDDEKFATKVEEEADEAICITMLGVDGALSITRSSHSVGQSLAILTVKLMIGLRIGLWGTVAMATAATEIKAAVCDREHHEVKEDEDLSFLIEQMKPGWSAVIAVYAEYYVQAACSQRISVIASNYGLACSWEWDWICHPFQWFRCWADENRGDPSNETQWHGYDIFHACGMLQACILHLAACVVASLQPV